MPIRNYKPEQIVTILRQIEIQMAVRAGEKLGQERRESGGPWRSKNRPPEICLRKRSQEERFRGIPEGCTQWSYMHAFGERFMLRGRANGR